MRRFILTLGLVALAWQARASDYDIPVLRGSSPDVQTPYVPAPPVYVGWVGFYAGVQAGFSRAGVNYTSSVQPLVGQIARNSVIGEHIETWTVLPPSRTDASSFNGGAFVGYNTQWDDAVLGFELNYGHTNLRKAISDSIGPLSFVDNTNAPPTHTIKYDVTIAGSASVQINDIWTGRFRGGWVCDTFLPYGFVGVAVARASTFRSASVSGEKTELDSNGNPVANSTITGPIGLPSLTDSQGGLFTWGYTAGVGADYMLTPTVFVRGEWEYIALPDVKSTKVNINTFRSALAVRF